MASDIAGLFTSPESIRQKRLDEIAAQQAANARMGGSWDSLLGQIAASGNTTGAMLAEAGSSMFGLKTPEEAKAAAIEGMAAGIDTNTPEGLQLFARKLNEQGMTAEAIKVFEIAKAREAQQLDMEYKKKQMKNLKEDPDWDIKVIGSEYDPRSMTTKSKYAWVNRRTQETRPISAEEAQTAGADTVGGVTLETSPEQVQDWVKQTQDKYRKRWAKDDLIGPTDGTEAR